MTWQIHHFNSVSSTMDVAKQLLTQHPMGGYVVCARQQEQGRGRQQRSWSSPPGNFYATFVVSLNDLSTAPFYSYITALALYDAIEPLTGAKSPLTLKWPNDLLFDSKKMGGILLEVETIESSAESSAKGTILLIGVGVNLKTHPGDTPYGATNLAEHNFYLVPEQILEKFCLSFDHWRDIFDQQGFEPLRQCWLERRDPAHDKMLLKKYDPKATDHLEGSFYDLDESGCLVLSCEEKGKQVLKKVRAGDVFFS